ncbi:MAG TPA: MotA/TolQ/ExbB proton channel family protein [Polyangiaceae bacterium]|jgi:biopolymer transport protein ExbB|nr:MotA/TolQ/ExbB proton channel family protein [Polyangiaceae bacterium]
MSDSISALVVKGALALLVAFSVVTWTLIVVKGLQVFRAARKDERLKRALGESSLLPDEDLLRAQDGPTARVARVGVSAWESVKPKANEGGLEVSLDILERGLKRQVQKERRLSESGLAILGSIGTTSPFVGLFGTVWGIMHALKRISGAGSASLDVVAGPIGEALVATGIGIAVAVPAVLAYNFFVRRLKVQSADLEDFANWLVGVALEDRLSAQRERFEHERVVAKISDARGAAPLREARV